MKLGELFTRTDIQTSECRHCSVPAVVVASGPTHFVADPNGAKTAWDECYTETPAGRRKYLGTTAEVGAA